MFFFDKTIFKEVKIFFFTTLSVLGIFNGLSILLFYVSMHNGYFMEKAVMTYVSYSAWKDIEKDSSEPDCSEVFGLEVDDDTLKVVLFGMSNKDLSCIIHHIEKNNLKKFEFDFNFGGQSMLGISMGEYLKNNEIQTKVMKSCASACVSMIVGIESKVCEKANVGLHQGKLLLDDVTEEHRALMHAIDIITHEHYKDSGINMAFHKEVISKTPFEDMYYLTHEDLIDNGYVKEIVACPTKNKNVAKQN